MHIVMFYHSIVSDWNHGNAHFLRGIVTELMARGHRVDVYEPENGWSFSNLIREKGEVALAQFRKAYPSLEGKPYRLEKLQLDRALAGADLVIVHEWNEHELVHRISEHRRKNPHYRLLFHDTHHRSVTDYRSMSAYDLSGFDGVLAYGRKIRDIYLANRWIDRAWVWHEAADVRVFHPMPGEEKEGDLVWVGNWGDGERTEEIREFFVEPVRRLRLKATAYGVRYPESAIELLAEAGIRYGGWLPNFEVPKVFSKYRVTLHIPRRPYAKALPGIPTIRPFEALACGIPLVSAPWEDSDGLFRPGKDFLFARDGHETERVLKQLLSQPQEARQLARNGLETIMQHHTCSHRIDALISICGELGLQNGAPGEKALNEG
ncbi:glycosyltransferase [Geomonas sp. RF6]|uniref:CgeB family protein n=1 Tax=Geomonas sp. RF6 TaxID=2897342 RepID=UPI001E60718D|nr:glycosyltransferase [Geomonas sp. RF6]UFS72146.1 glycosyltransferase [Geomonas sp. RF6]